MKIRKIIFYFLAVVLGGCVPIASLYPLYNQDDVIFEQKLAGDWVQDSNETTWQFSRPDPNEKTHRLVFTDDEQRKGLFKARLVKISDKLFLDISPIEFPCDIEDANNTQWFYNAFFLVPAHTFLLVDSIEPELKLKLLLDDKVEKLLKRDPKAISHVTVDDRIILNAPPKELQAFLLKHVDDEDFFGEPIVLRRKESAKLIPCGEKDTNEQDKKK